MPDEGRVVGYCPVCGFDQLWLVHGVIACGSDECTDPTAVTRLLADDEHEHIVTLGWASFTIRHPLRERLDDALMECDLSEWVDEQMGAQNGPLPDPGRYRASADGDGGWKWEPVS